MNLRRLVQIAPLLLLIAACSKNPLPLTQPEKQTMTELTASLKTRCVGRYLIDMPSDALSTGLATIQGVTFEAIPMARTEFEEQIAARETELLATKSRDGYQFMYDRGEVRGVPNSKYFVTLGNSNADSDLGRVIEAYKWDAGYQVKLEVKATDSIHSEFEKRVKGTPYESKDWKVNDVPEKTNLVLDLIRKVRGRADDEIPAEPGVCFLGGFLPRKAAVGESISVFFAMKDKSDVSFELATDTDVRDKREDTLPGRLRQIRSEIKEANGRIIRTGAAEVEGIDAQEVLISGTSVTKTVGHTFLLEANTATSGALNPFLTVSLYDIQIGALTEGEAIALWDTVSRTLRPRPNGF
ncbi:T6SS immunity protein Tli4 family protein [Caballeronia humi]|uniref:Lipoprotein n=1 Tax=Caballeronia humi TaxID=326474 RepID=A0A158GMA3_9BURK|nr:T6SS immunity protein Tli4 family protein [Caballeronia humi]SAL33073.1 putative lipoprotein [Caballeronia humi]